MRKKILTAIALTSACALASCSKTTTSQADLTRSPIVSINEQTLYKADLDSYIPKTLSPQDSTIMADAYIKKWIENQLLFNKATQNIVDKAQIEKLVEDYRRSLVTSSYLDNLLKQEVEPNITNNELSAFYEQNKEKLQLDENIIKGLYLKIPIESAQLAQFKRWYTQTGDDAKSNIEKNALKGAVAYEYFYDKWVNLDDVMDKIPFVMTDAADFLKKTKNLEIQDSSFVYLLNIKEYKFAGEQPPFDYIKNKLTESVLEMKRTDFVQQTLKDLYDKATEDDDIKYYNK